MHDTQGWIRYNFRNLRNYLRGDFDSMGNRAKVIAETKNNYRLFTERVVKYIEQLVK